MKEIWKDIPGYEGRYQASNLGNILALNYKRSHKPHLLKQSITYDGYHRVCLGNGSRKNTKRITVHILVAKTFIPNPENKPQVNHIDGNKDNNCASNLEWVTCKENIQHSIKIGLRNPKNRHYLYGSNHHCSKPILQYDLQGNFIKKWGSQVEAAKYYNCDSCAISNCAVGHSKSYKGFIWRFPNGEIHSKIEVEHHHLSPRIIQQYSLNDELLKEWNGYKELFAEHPEYKAPSISACCHGTQKSAYGYKWKSTFI